MCPVICTRLEPSGGWEIADILQGQYIRRRYFGFTYWEARRAFRDETRTLQED